MFLTVGLHGTKMIARRWERVDTFSRKKFSMTGAMTGEKKIRQTTRTCTRHPDGVHDMRHLSSLADETPLH